MSGSKVVGFASFRHLAGERLRAVRARTNRRSWLLYASLPGLSGVNAVVGLILPALLGPAAFGEYSLAVTLFQYGLIFDLGLSQVIDRRAPVLAATSPAELGDFVGAALGTRLYIAAITAVLASLLLFGLSTTGRLPFSLAAGLLSLWAGLLFMLALGPMSVWRALSRRRAFALASVAGGLALAVARPVGIMLHGPAGSFAGLLLCYAALVIALERRMEWRRQWPSPGRAGRLIAAGLPLFVTSMIWAIYMTANRWVVSAMATPLELGHFAFGANVLALLVGTVAALAQLYYPAIVSRVAAGPRFSVSGRVLRDLGGLGLLMGVAAVIGILVGPLFIHLIYTSFVGSEGPVRVLLVGLPSLVVSSWLMPLALATAERPWVESVATYPLALALLAGATALGFRMGGLNGAAWGGSAAAPFLLVFQLVSLRLNGMLTSRHAISLLGLVAAMTAVLAGVAAVQ